jgi:hypothetical protein
MSDSPVLTQEEADRLISMLKRSLLEYINLPQPGKSLDFDVQGDSRRKLFTINIFSGKISRGKRNYGARIKINGIMLMELHINKSARHKNPDGTIINGSHWHLYREGYGRQYAFPADSISSDDFVSNTLYFLKKFNVIGVNEVHEQLHL